MASPAEKRKKYSSADHCLISSAKIAENQQISLSGSSFETAFGGEQKKKMENRILKREIWICSDVWMDIFPHFDRPQIGLKLALLSPRFDVLVDTHFDGKSELTVWRSVEIRKETQSKKPILLVRMSDGGFLKFALPDSPLPNKIRFRKLYIMYTDHSVIEFLHANQQIFGNSTHLALKIFPSAAEGTGVVKIWPPIIVPNIRHLRASARADHLDNFCRLILPTILSDLAQLNSIGSLVMFPDALADDGPTAATCSSGQALSKWLHTPRKDGQPKRLRCFGYYYSPAAREFEWINNFKEAFLRATTTNSPVNYNVRFATKKSTPIVPFELVNERTQEKLTLEKESEDYFANHWLLKRWPIFGGTAAAEDNLYANVDILLYGGNDCCIGPLYPPTRQTSNSAEEN